MKKQTNKKNKSILNKLVKYYTESNNDDIQDNVVEFKALSVFAPYFINGDVDGLEDDEIQKADAFIDRIRQQHGKGHITVDSDEYEEDFGKCEITGLGGNRSLFKYVIMEPIEEDLVSKDGNQGVTQNEYVTKFLQSADDLLQNWDKIGLNKNDNYPTYLPSFDEFIADMSEFFMSSDYDGVYENDDNDEPIREFKSVQDVTKILGSDRSTDKTSKVITFIKKNLDAKKDKDLIADLLGFYRVDTDDESIQKQLGAYYGDNYLMTKNEGVVVKNKLVESANYYL